MVGVGVAGCLNCGCGGTESCCIPDEFTFVWDTPSCSFDDGEVTMTKTTLDSISVNLQYKPRNGEVWIGTYLTDGMCEDDAHHVDLYIYCTSIGGVANIVVEAFCYDSAGNLLSWALGKDPDFTCDPFSFAVTTDLGSICCSCDLGGGVDSGVDVPCCEQSLPSTLYGTITGTLNGSITLVWDGTGWEGETTACGDSFAFRLDCLPIINGPGCNSMQVGPPTSVSPACTVSPAVPTETCYCDPLQLTYTNIATQNGTGTCCAGTVTIVITE